MCCLNDSETEFLGRFLVGHYVSHASFPEHRLAFEGADSRHSGKHPYLDLENTDYLGFLVDENALSIYIYYICIACDGGYCIWTRAGVSEVGTWTVENLCGLLPVGQPKLPPRQVVPTATARA